MISNAKIYYAIAKDNLAKAKEIESLHRRPKPDGNTGHIITYDPSQGSFRHSLIAIAFAGIYFDALIYIEGTKRLGEKAYGTVERKPYEIKLKALGISDPEVLSECVRFRKSRNDLVHEKALESFASTRSELRFAQREAKNAIDFIDRISKLLSYAP